MRFSAMLATGSLMASLVAAAAPPSAATDWTTFGFDAQRTGYNPSETVLGPGNAGGLKLAWSLATGDMILTQPVVIGTKVYVGTLAGDLVAVDRVTGEVAWTRATGSWSLWYCGLASVVPEALSTNSPTTLKPRRSAYSRRGRSWVSGSWPLSSVETLA